MQTNIPETATIYRDRRRRRWIIRLGLCALLLLVLLTASYVYLFSSSAMTAQEATAALARLQPIDTRENAERLLGKPYSERDDNGALLLTWVLITHHFMEVETFQCMMSCDQQGQVRIMNYGAGKIEGWNAWLWRWHVIKHRLGMK